MEEKELRGKEKDLVGRVEGEPFRRGKELGCCVFDAAVRGGVVNGVGAGLGKRRRLRDSRGIGCKGRRGRYGEEVEVHLGAKAPRFVDGGEPAGKGNEIF